MRAHRARFCRHVFRRLTHRCVTNSFCNGARQSKRAEVPVGRRLSGRPRSRAQSETPSRLPGRAPGEQGVSWVRQQQSARHLMQATQRADRRRAEVSGQVTRAVRVGLSCAKCVPGSRVALQLGTLFRSFESACSPLGRLHIGQYWPCPEASSVPGLTQLRAIRACHTCGRSRAAASRVPSDTARQDSITQAPTSLDNLVPTATAASACVVVACDLEAFKNFRERRALPCGVPRVLLREMQSRRRRGYGCPLSFTPAHRSETTRSPEPVNPIPAVQK